MEESFKCYAIVPPSEDTLKDFPMQATLAISSDSAWQRFCYPSLRREAYEQDGFKAVRVEVTIKTI